MTEEEWIKIAKENGYSQERIDEILAFVEETKKAGCFLGYEYLPIEEVIED